MASHAPAPARGWRQRCSGASHGAEPPVGSMTWRVVPAAPRVRLARRPRPRTRRSRVTRPPRGSPPTRFTACAPSALLGARPALESSLRASGARSDRARNRRNREESGIQFSAFLAAYRAFYMNVARMPNLLAGESRVPAFVCSRRVLCSSCIDHCHSLLLAADQWACRLLRDLPDRSGRSRPLRIRSNKKLMKRHGCFP